jgi:multiple sugar transport system ATP-binding protein
MRIELSRLHEELNATMIYVTHDQIEAMTMADKIVVLQAGKVEQVGSPLELYHHPANLFVAGFIGSPAMNLFTARLSRVADGAQLTIGEGADARTLSLAGTAANDIAGQATSEGRSLALGVRPEDLRLVGEGAPNTLVGTAEVVEHLGNEQVVYLKAPGALNAQAAETQGVTARVGAGLDIRPGAQIYLQPDFAHLHFFDPATGQRFL